MNMCEDFLMNANNRKKLDDALAQVAAGRVARIELSEDNVFEEMKVLSLRGHYSDK